MESGLDFVPSFYNRCSLAMLFAIYVTWLPALDVELSSQIRLIPVLEHSMPMVNLTAKCQLSNLSSFRIVYGIESL